jgi:hypothetical protein
MNENVSLPGMIKLDALKTRENALLNFQRDSNLLARILNSGNTNG